MQLDQYETTNTRERLSGHLEQRGWKFGFAGIITGLFGGAFFAAGVAIILVGLKKIEVNPSTVHVPYPILAVFGAVFAVAGLYVWGLSAVEWISKLRIMRAARSHPEEPAYKDYAWDSDGYTPPRWRPVVNKIGMAAFMTLFLSMFNWWAFAINGPLVVKIIVGVLDAATVLVWVSALRQLWHSLKFSGSRIQFTEFPYKIGRPMTLLWNVASGLHHVTKGSFTLRCVEQWFEERGSGDNRSKYLVQEMLWSGTWHINQPRSFARGEQIELKFDPPADLPGTALSADKPMFWELEVKLDVPGLDFHERYLVPIYKR